MSTLVTNSVQSHTGQPVQFPHGISVGAGVNNYFERTEGAPCIVKTSALTAELRGGTGVNVVGKILGFAANTPISMPASMTPGTDFAVYVCQDSTVRADASFVAPAGYTTIDSRKIGGFHFGLTSAINQYSIWDLRHRPACPDPRGMVLVNGLFWVDVYLCNSNPVAYGTSKAGVAVASGTVLPTRAAVFGGGSYSNMDWYTANEIAASNGKRLLSEAEFSVAAYGVTENQSLGGAASTIPTTAYQAGYRSVWGCEQMTGHHLVWGADSGTRWDAPGGWGWRNSNGGAGQLYIQGDYSLTRVLLGGSRAGGAYSGSRCSHWGYHPWRSYWDTGLRAASDHLSLA